MKVCVYGAGAIGGHMAARLLARGEAEVSVVARGAHLAAIREDGLWLETEGTRVGGRPAAATDDPGALPRQDIVIVTLKAHDAPGIAPALSRLLAPDGVVVPYANGIPWWWKAGTASPGPLSLVDPGGALWSAVGPGRVLGGVVYSGNEMLRPGVIRHRGSNRWPLGEPDGTLSERARRVADLLAAAGMASTAVPDIRREVLRKLTGNICGNPISALTRLPGWTNHPETGIADVGRRIVTEMLDVAAALGFDLRGEVDPAALVRPEGRPGGRSSMLQDVDLGRPVEAEAILGQVQAFGRDSGVATPTIDTVVALLRCLDLSLRAARAGASS
jgi:2-dehydropantoate 2-reductase